MIPSIKKIYTRQVVRIQADEDLAKADETMNNYNIRHLPVIDKNNFLVGIISRSDFNGLRYVDSRFTGFKVKDVMSAPVKVMSPNTSVSHVARLMIDHKISSVLIGTEDSLIGIITTDDLMRLLLDMDENREKLEQIDLQSLADEGWISATFN